VDDLEAKADELEDDARQKAEDELKNQLRSLGR
jgi:hypothetical protein